MSGSFAASAICMSGLSERDVRMQVIEIIEHAKRDLSPSAHETDVEIYIRQVQLVAILQTANTVGLPRSPCHGRKPGMSADAERLPATATQGISRVFNTPHRPCPRLAADQPQSPCLQQASS